MIDRRLHAPLYIQVKNSIIEDIEQGKIKIGDKLMSEPEMQKYYGVARPTIRAALSELVNEGCIRKEHGLGTFCIALPKKETLINVDVILDQADTYFYPYILKGISQVLENNNCNLFYHDTRKSVMHVTALLEKILARGTDGVIMIAVSQGDPFWLQHKEVLQQYQNAKIPFIFLMGTPPLNHLDFMEHSIHLTVDGQYGAEVAAQYLLDCGHRRVLGVFPQGNRNLRAAGFRQATGHVRDVEAFEITNQDDFNTIPVLVREKQITAIQCYNDLVAVECLRVLTEHGLRVPDDVSLIGFDDTDLSRAAIPQLTTITHPKDRLGNEAATLLLRKIRNPNEQQNDVIYRPGLVIRQSVRTV